MFYKGIQMVNKMTIDNLHEFSIALAEKQELTILEQNLLGQLFLLLGEAAKTITENRIALILDHLVQVNDFFIKQKEGKK